MIGVVETAAEYDKNGIDIRFLNHTKEANITVSPPCLRATLGVVA